VEGCYFVSVSVCFSVSQAWINFFSLLDGLRHLFGDHSNDGNPLETVAGAVS
jgi:hypothetical protein